jgi:hypothetical protein
MTTIIPFLQEDAFDPDELRAMSTALEEVSRTLQLDGDQRAREIIAVRIVDLARRGERDPEKLRDRVLREAGAMSSDGAERVVGDEGHGLSNGAGSNV